MHPKSNNQKFYINCKGINMNEIIRNINIVVDGNTIGAAQLLEIDDCDDNYFTGFLYRARLNKEKVKVLFNRGYISAKSQKRPFNI
jgi:hypothetical protein